jgi:hypothetical protein
VVNIKNRSRTLYMVNLQRGVDYGNDARCAGSHFKMTVPVVLEDGKVAKRVVEKDLPGCLIWLPGEVKYGLPDAVSNIEQVKNAMPRTLIQVR